MTRIWSRIIRLCLLVTACLAATACSGTESSSPTPALPTLDVFVPTVITPTPARSVQSGSPGVVSSCTNDARFVEDLTVPDGENVEPSQKIDKRWSVQNSGSCDWGPGYRLVRLSADDFGGPDEVALYPARAGTGAVWQVVLEAPESVGEFRSRWQAQAPDGSMFGEDVFLVVVVSP